MERRNLNLEHLNKVHEKRLHCLSEADRITDEMIRVLKEAGYDVDSITFDDVIKRLEERQKK